jgi:multiple antibiotic resistance protein
MMEAFGTFFGLSFSALLPLINPLGSALIFLGLVGPAPPSFYRTLAKRIAISTTLFLIVIEALGTAMLKFFGISLPVMQLAGGLVLAAIGWNTLNQREPDPQDETNKRNTLGNAAAVSLESKAFYPLTFPITAGPGCIVVLVTLSAHASAKSVIFDITAHAGIAVAVVVLSATVYVCYGYAQAITARVNAQTVQGILRVISFVLLCIGVQIAWNGAEVLLKTLLKL